MMQLSIKELAAKDKELEKLHCFWCTSPIGCEVRCPMKYNPPKKHRVYEFTNDKPNEDATSQTKPNEDVTFDYERVQTIYSINENMCQSRAGNTSDCFVYFGHYCSNECCLAFISDKKCFDNSFEIASILFKKVYVGKPAPHWQKLKKFGGAGID